MNSDGSIGNVRAFVHLAHGFGARNWRDRQQRGEVVGLNERLPYGYFWAAENGFKVRYSEDDPESLPARVIRLFVRGVLGFDFIHAWRNCGGILDSDVVWTHTESQHLAVLLLLRLRRRRRRRPKVIAQSIWLFDHWPRFLPPRRAFYRWLLSRADLLTVHSPANLQRARALFPHIRSELVLYGIRTDAMRDLPRPAIQSPIHLLALGNDEHRDWHTAIAAVRGWKDCVLQIASRSLRDNKIRGIGNVTKAAPRSMNELEALYDWTNIVVLPLRRNLHASGITVILEATSYGIPVICTDTGGLRAYFSDDEVLYVPPYDVQELRRAITRLASDDDRRRTQVERARNRIGSKNLSSRSYALRHAELSRELLYTAEQNSLTEPQSAAAGPQAKNSVTPPKHSAGWTVAVAVLLAATGLGVPVHAAEPEKSPAGAAGTIDLCAFRPTFTEDFNSLNVSGREDDRGRWYSHTPWNGDFGDAVFSDPKPGFPFTVHDGVLRIEARKDADGKWRSGLLSSVHPDGTGFVQHYGYFEARAKLPPGPGVWPAFWLNTNPPQGSTDPGVEIDAIEYYGQFTSAYHSALHIWDNSGGNQNRVADHIIQVDDGSLTREFHTFGVDVEPDWIKFYRDRRETWRVETPPELTRPLMLLVNLALGSGWPIDKTPNPSVMEIDYVHAYEPALSGRTQGCG